MNNNCQVRFPECGKELIKDSAKQLDIANQRDYFIAQRNDMVQNQRFKGKSSGKSLTLTEEKVLGYLISRIKPDATTLEPMLFDIKNFCEVCGLARGKTDNCYPQVKAAVEQLARRVMWLSNDDGSETTVRYIERITMSKKSGKILIVFDKMLEPYLINLAGSYFQFSYHNILAMNSKYSIQLYKLLKSLYFRYPCVRFDVSDLKERLDATCYNKISDFKERVIEKAIKDINMYTDMNVSVEYIKTGRSITHILFTMQDLSCSKDHEAQREATQRYKNVENAIIPNVQVASQSARMFQM